MNKSIFTALIGISAFLIPMTASATPVSWDFAGSTLQPLQSGWSALVKASRFQATSTTASIFPFASTTALSATTLCISTDCRTSWPSAGSSIGTISTSTVPTVGHIPYWTSAGYPSLLGSIATTSLTATAPLVLSQPISVIGSSASALTIATTTNSLFTGSLGQVLGYTADGWTGIATSSLFTFPWTVANGGTGVSSFTSSQLLYGNGTNALSSVATSSIALGTGFSYSGTLGAFVGGADGTLTLSGIANASLANSTISGIALGSNLADLTATNSTLTFSGAYNGGTARTVGLNLGNANTWTALQQFANASSTLFSAGVDNSFSVFGNGNVGVASSTPIFSLSVGTGNSAFYISTSTGKIVGYDSTNAWNGRISPTRSFVLGTGTTTAWTASTTGSVYSPYLIMPFAGTLRQVRCATDASFLGVNVVVNGSNATPSYFVGSTTVGTVGFTAGNTFSAGQKILTNFGTTTTATATAINCTFDVTETP